MDYEKIIHGTLSRIHSDGNCGAVIDSLARSLSESISYDRSLNGIDEETLSSALLNGGSSLEHSVLLSEIRETRERIRQKREKDEKRKEEERNMEIISWGFFLQCWHAYMAEDDVCSVRLLTVRFLAKWLRATGRYVEQDELEWCARRAVKDAERLNGREKEERMNASYDEAVVLLVMDKFRRASAREPEKYRRLFDEKREAYRQYSLERFGYEPDWTPTGYRRPQVTSAFTNRFCDERNRQ